MKEIEADGGCVMFHDYEESNEQKHLALSNLCC